MTVTFQIIADHELFALKRGQNALINVFFFLFLIGTIYISTEGSFGMTRLITDEKRNTTNSNVTIKLILMYFRNFYHVS